MTTLNDPEPEISSFGTLLDGARNQIATLPGLGGLLIPAASTGLFNGPLSPAILISLMEADRNLNAPEESHCH